MAVTRWQDSANCIGIDVEAFFSPDETRQYRDVPLLKRVCGNCDVLNECKEYSLKYMVRGWWGNTSEAERDRIRRKLNIIPLSIVKESQ